MNLNIIIAENLKRLRLERNLSLGQLSELCGVSKVMLSQIEKAETNPTINTIWKIAKGLKVPYTALIDEPSYHTELIRSAEAKKQSSEDGAYRIYCYYGNSQQRNFEMFRIELDQGAEYTSIGHMEKSQEYLMVLEGSLTLEADNQQYTIGAEDAICFSSVSAHTYRNEGDRMVKAMIINYFPL